MDTFEFNKIAGALLFSVLVILGLNNLADIIYAPHQLAKPGFVVEVAKAGSGTQAESSATTKAVPAAKAEASLASLLASANVDAGKKIAKKCAACHTLNKGGKNKVGPHLYDVVGRKMASIAGFSYSDAIKKKSESVGTWSFEALNKFLTKPKSFIPKTKMGFSGIKKPGGRANLLVYLRTLSDSPITLPATQ